MSMLILSAAAVHAAFALIATLALRESGETRPSSRVSILIVAWLLPLFGPIYVSCGLYANDAPPADLHDG